MTWQKTNVRSFKETMRWEADSPDFIEGSVVLHGGNYFWSAQISGGVMAARGKSTTLERAQENVVRHMKDIVAYIKEELKC